MKTKKPLESVGWLGGSSNYTVINEAARREASMKPWSIRISAAIAKAEAGVAIHEKTVCAGHDNSCVGCVQDAALGLLAPAMAKALWGVVECICEDCAVDGEPCEECAPLIAFCEKMEGLSND